MATARSIRHDRRLARDSFANFVDWTYKWESNYNEDDGTGYRLEPWDYSHHFVGTIQRFQGWRTCNYLAPRTAAKSTLNMLASIWTKWQPRYRYLQHLTVTAVTNVANDQYRTVYRWCRDHPLLEDMRPLNANESTRQFDVPGNRTKGRSFRWITADGRVTGLRCHWLNVDDLEIKETIGTPEQRLKMRLFLSECHNLLYGGRQRTWIVKVGTPWDTDTIYRNLNADVNIEIPAIIVDGETGELFFPFAALPEDVLELRKIDLNNPVLYNAQYLMDTDTSDVGRPIKAADMVFERFDPRSLNNRSLIMDPAGGKNANELRDIRLGEVEADGMGVMGVGTKGNKLYISRVFSQSTTAEKYLNAAVRFAKDIAANRAYVENNFGGKQGWPHTVRMTFNSAGIDCGVEDFYTKGNKLNRVLGALVPLFGTSQVVFHEDLRMNPMVCDEQQSQFLNVRWTHLPAKKDVVDMATMAVEQLHEYLYSNAPELEDNSLAAQARRANAPSAVRRLLRGSGTNTIQRVRTYSAGRR